MLSFGDKKKKKKKKRPRLIEKDKEFTSEQDKAEHLEVSTKKRRVCRFLMLRLSRGVLTRDISL